MLLNIRIPKLTVTSTVLALIGGLLLGVLPSRAAEATAENTPEQIALQELKSLNDPTILKRRVWLETEWNRFKDDSDNLEETLGGQWAWRLSDHWDWSVRAKLPYKWHIAGDSVGDSSASGLGDVKLAAGLAHRFSDTWRIGGGLELQMPTAQENLGDDVWKVQEFCNLAWDATRWLTLAPSIEYNQSVAEENGASPQHNTELYFPAIFILPQRWSLTARYKLKVDFEQGNDVTQTAQISLSKQLENPPLGFTLSFEKPFENGNKDFQVNFSATYFFQSQKSRQPQIK